MNLGSKTICTFLIQGLWKGKKKTIKNAAGYFKIAADLGEVESMFFYDNMVYGGEGVPVNYDEASKYYKMAAKKGNPDAMYSYGNLLFKGEGVKHNKKEESRYYKMAADNDQLWNDSY